MFPVKYLAEFSNSGADIIQRCGFKLTKTSGRIRSDRLRRKRHGKTSCLEQRGGNSESQFRRIGKVKASRNLPACSLVIPALLASKPIISASSIAPIK